MTILSCDTPLTESGVLALVPPENRFEESASIARTTWKERLALKIIRGKLKKETRQIQAGKKSAAKSQFLALILCFFLGYLGIHRFYLGYVGIGLIQLFTAGLCGIWTFIDFILLIFGGLKPKGEDFG
ncbi:MAG: TM2 domain-containing protein [Bacteroidia bacterium]|nr:TM2 domain-containing protein [Bacteroidia bacterium]